MQYCQNSMESYVLVGFFSVNDSSDRVKNFCQDYIASRWHQVRYVFQNVILKVAMHSKVFLLKHNARHATYNPSILNLQGSNLWW